MVEDGLIVDVLRHRPSPGSDHVAVRRWAAHTGTDRPASERRFRRRPRHGRRRRLAPRRPSAVRNRSDVVPADIHHRGHRRPRRPGAPIRGGWASTRVRDRGAGSRCPRRGAVPVPDLARRTRSVAHDRSRPDVGRTPPAGGRRHGTADDCAGTPWRHRSHPALRRRRRTRVARAHRRRRCGRDCGCATPARPASRTSSTPSVRSVTASRASPDRRSRTPASRSDSSPTCITSRRRSARS